MRESSNSLKREQYRRAGELIKAELKKEVNQYRMSDIVLQVLKEAQAEGKANQGSSLYPIDDNRVHESNRAFKGI